MLALGVVFGILLLMLLMAGMWLAFNMNDYGVNDWVDDEEENRVTERRSRVTRAEVRMDEVDCQTMQLDEREGRSQEVMAERTKPRGREEIYSISKHSPSVSLDSAISVGSPLDSTGKTSIVSHHPSPNQYQHGPKKPSWESSPTAFTLVFNSAEGSHPSRYPTPTSPHLPRSDHLTISLPPKSDIQAIRVVREIEEKPQPTSPLRIPSPTTKTHKISVHERKANDTPSPIHDPGMFSTSTPESAISKPSASPTTASCPASHIASASPSPTSPSSASPLPPSQPALDVCSTSSPPSTPASPHSAQISVLMESLPRRDNEHAPATAWPEKLLASSKDDHDDSFEEGFDQITLADRKPVRPVSTSYKLESLKLAASRAAIAPTKG